MNESLKNRTAAIRDYLGKMDLDPALSYSYAATAARWEAIRLLIHRRKNTLTDDYRYRELSTLLRSLTAKLGLPACVEGGWDAVPGITDGKGFLPKDCCRFLCKDWKEAAEMWSA